MGFDDYKDKFGFNTGGIWGQAGRGLKKIGLNGPTEGDEAKMANLNGVGAAGQGFADISAGNLQSLGVEAYDQRQRLLRLQNGQDSLANEQLRQGMQQGLSGQRSMAASAAPRDAAMAARTAANNMGRLSYGLSGQQALAGIQERRAATEALNGMIMGQRAQELQGALGGWGVATGAYGGGLNGQRDPTLASQLAGPIAGLAGFGGMGGGGGGK